MARSPEQSKPLYAYIDCVRGYAILLVITCHLTAHFPDLPWPVRRLTSFGWHGVQLFFLASALTLLLSWHFEVSRRGTADVRAFFIRRCFRIVPAYYAAGVFYALMFPPADGIAPLQLLTTAAFVNAWHPALGVWTVPGGWSVSVEVTFYFLFPLMAWLVTSLSRAVALFLGCVLLASITNQVYTPLLQQTYNPATVDNFVYFSFPNQIPVFALGGVLFFIIQATQQPRWAKPVALLSRYGTPLAFAAVAMFFAVAYLPLTHSVGLGFPYIPTFLLACVPLMAFIVVLSAGQRNLFVNRYVGAMGKASFSAYLFHIAVLDLLPGTFPGAFHVHETGVRAIIAYLIAWLVIIPVVYGVAYCSYRAIELPMINLGKNLIRSQRRRSAPDVVASTDRSWGA
jgi:peptidoglycan/LPS O-acetylase OafA/YrhL